MVKFGLILTVCISCCIVMMTLSGCAAKDVATAQHQIQAVINTPDSAQTPTIPTTLSSDPAALFAQGDTYLLKAESGDVNDTDSAEGITMYASLATAYYLRAELLLDHNSLTPAVPPTYTTDSSD